MGEEKTEDVDWTWPPIFANPDAPYLPDATFEQRRSAALTDQMVAYIGYFRTGHRPERFTEIMDELSFHSGAIGADQVEEWVMTKKIVQYPASDAREIQMIDANIRALERRKAKIIANYPPGQMPPPPKKKKEG